MISPTYKEFAELSKKGNVISVYQELFTDMETPLGIYSRLADSKYSFLLESVDGGENLGRYSFIGYEPAAVFYSKGQEITVEHDDGTVENFVVEDDPVQELRRRMQIYKAVETEGLPAFTGGTVGYFSYDATKFFEEIKQENSDDLDLPEIYFIFTKSIIVFDHVKHRMLIVANAFCEGRELEDVYAGACETIKKVREKLSSPLEFVPATVMDPAALALNADYQPPSNYSPEEFEDIVERCKEYIRSGDIIQVVPSQRFEFATQATPLSVYRSLRSVNPSPYLFLLKFDDMALVGSSPEVMIKVEGQDLDLRPIAGTRPRGETIAEDLAYEKDLLADEKELAEHTMLVDLGRNDLGRVSQFNTVEIPELMVIERYSHVMHIVSDVRGKLLPGKDAFDVLKATFPAGTVSGAPKIRAMEIIEEMEKTRRGPYAGTVCYLGYDNNLNSCITIRTVVMKNGKAYIQAGAGIVADSVAEMEYKETVNKAKAMIKAIKMAELLN